MHRTVAIACFSLTLAPKKSTIQPANGPRKLRDLKEIIEERYGRSSTLITIPLPVEAWNLFAVSTAAVWR